MRKTFMGVRLRTLHERSGLTQAALAQRLGLSPSYLNQIEHDQRPLSVPVLLKLQATLGVDLQWFSEDDEARLLAQLQEAVAGSGGAEPVAQAELQALARQMPGLARRVIELHRHAHDTRQRLEALAGQVGDRELLARVGPAQPHEAVRDFFYARHNHVAELDALAEALHAELGAASPSAADLAPALQQRLERRHGVRVQVGAADSRLRRYDPASRTLQLHADLAPGQRCFQMAVQLARLEAGAPMAALVADPALPSDEARALARIGLASYFAGALLLPYGAFLGAAEALGYDIELLARRFGVSFETACHRLSTLQRPGAPGVPFFFVRVDRAGNISKRQSATDFHFSRTGGTCPLWTVYEAFAQPDQVLTQLAQMPDGRRYLWIARCVTQHDGGWGRPGRRFAVALGCDLRHAGRLVYGRGLALDRADAALPIGPGCKVCERHDCAQRAYPALGRALRIEEDMRPREPYASA
ncbi:short-chain fatty acyl-CoA regulator family protein [Rubrivivax gelatinosus]|uniref:short-chain fatty acyl-CoA regulator family protein n=1 Tax=Rubrivivax gelatinosus TaxID=28068 RepID=UPI003A80C375